MGLNSVFIVESPSPEDIYECRSEGEPICRVVTLNGLACETRCTANEAALKRAVAEYTGKVAASPKFPPVLHVSAHGCTGGLALSDERVVPWPDFLELLRQANELADEGIVLCISCCYGSSAANVSDPNPSRPAFRYLVTNKASPTWPQTTIGFATFYHYLIKEQSLESAVEAMRASSLNQDFVLVKGGPKSRASRPNQPPLGSSVVSTLP